jgi:hypothetical protein
MVINDWPLPHNAPMPKCRTEKTRQNYSKSDGIRKTEKARKHEGPLLAGLALVGFPISPIAWT